MEREPCQGARPFLEPVTEILKNGSKEPVAWPFLEVAGAFEKRYCFPKLVHSFFSFIQKDEIKFSTRVSSFLMYKH